MNKSLVNMQYKFTSGFESHGSEQCKYCCCCCYVH